MTDKQDGYVPVEPESGLVHDNGPDIDTTKCGKRLAWVKHVMLIDIRADWCPACYPLEQKENA